VNRALLLILLTIPAIAGEPSRIEDSNFLPETGWNRTGGVLQYTSFFLGDAAAHELTHEWAASSPRHQLSYTIPLYTDGETGLGDATINYRYQLFGRAGSRLAVAPRLSLVLPTRSGHFGLASSGVQVNVPISVSMSERLASHTSAGATWFRDRDEKELNFAQSLAFSVTPRIALSLDAAYTRCEDAEHLFVLRPGVQFTIQGPGGLQIAPGVAIPLGTDARGVLLFVALERSVAK
jgi:hypothetical protein